MQIGPVNTDNRIVVVGEIGNNHEGDIRVAERLIHEIADAHADAVKLQVFRTESFVAPSDRARFARMKTFELGAPAVRRLAEVTRRRELAFIATPLDLESVDMLAPLVDAFKIASGDITFVPLLRAVAATRKPVILSSGASTLAEVRDAIATVRHATGGSAANTEIAVLHCVSCYPAPAEEAQLRAIPVLSSALDVTVGYSDHVLGLDACVAAAALGARILEKHVTIDRHYSSFRDHQLSLEPGELAELVRRVRTVAVLLGNAEKRVQPCETSMVSAIRRSVAAARDLPAGHRVSPADIVWLRPAGGIAPGQEQTVLGATLARSVSAGNAFQPEDFAT